MNMNDKINSTLRAWSKEKQASPEHLDSLAKQIRTEAARSSQAGFAGEGEVSRAGFWYKLSYAGLGAAAALITVFSCFLYTGSDAPSSSSTGLASISAQQLLESGRLFTEMGAVFGDGLRWVAESDGEVGVGVDQLIGGSSANGKTMLVRLVVLSKHDGDADWHPAWNADVLLRGEDIAEVVPNKNVDNKLALWVYPLSDGRIAIDTDLALDIPVRLSSRRSMVVKQGEVRELISIKENGTQYRLIQTVSVLGAGENGA